MTVVTRTAEHLLSFARSGDGGISILTAGLAVVIVAFTGLAVDLGSIAYWQSRLQAVTDAAALAASLDLTRPAAIAATAFQANGLASVVIEGTDVGTYSEDPSIAGTARFAPGTPENAVRLTARYDVPVYFMKMFTGQPNVSAGASAIAYNLPLAGIAIGTNAVNSGIAQLNNLIAALVGSSPNLTLAERNALDATPISAFRLIDQLALASGGQDQTIETVMASGVNLTTLAGAAAAALSAQASSLSPSQSVALTALSRIAGGSGGSPSVQVSEFFAFRAHQKRAAKDLVSASNDSIGVPALSLLMGYAQTAKQNALVNVNQVIALPGIATISVSTVLSKTAIGAGPKGIAAIGPVGASAYSSQGRVKLDISLLTPISINLGLINLSLPLTIPVIADIGYGSASISSITCGPDRASATDIAVGAQSGAVRLYIGTAPLNQLENMTAPLSPSPAVLISTPLVSVSGSTNADIAQSGLQTLHFDWSDIGLGTVKRVDGTPSITAALQQANTNLSIAVTNAPLGIGALLSPLVRTQVSAVLTALQPVLDPLLANLGIRAGTIDVRATAVRCGLPALVM